MPTKKIAIIGFGEAGSIFAEDFAKQGHCVAVYDVLIEDRNRTIALKERSKQINVQLCQSTEEAVHDAELIFSAVTAVASSEVATEVANTIKPAQIFFDINSVSPKTKRYNGSLIEKSGATYIDVAVMGPVPPTRLNVSLLLGGKNSSHIAETLNKIGMNAKSVSEDIGIAAAIKMCRSVVVKGLEAITLECFYAAKFYGAEQQVLESLQQTFPGLGWGAKEPNYMISRVAEHGRRRAAEMRESAITIQEAGIEPRMATAIAQTEDWLIDLMEKKGLDYDKNFDWNAFIQQLLK